MDGVRTHSSCSQSCCPFTCSVGSLAPRQIHQVGRSSSKLELNQNAPKGFQFPSHYVGGDNPGGSTLSVCLQKLFVCKISFLCASLKPSVCNSPSVVSQGKIVNLREISKKSVKSHLLSLPSYLSWKSPLNILPPFLYICLSIWKRSVFTPIERKAMPKTKVLLQRVSWP